MPDRPTPSWWRRYDEPREVEIRHTDGKWYVGFCAGWTHSEAGWRADCTYTVAVGSKFVRSVPPECVRQVDAPS